MADYGASDTSTTTLLPNQFPISEVYVPNGSLTALEGGPVSTDSGGKKSAPASMYIKDGGNVTFGAQADTPATTDSGTFSFVALFKRLLAKFTISTALTPYGSNPSQTAAAGADTLYRFGAGGTTSFNHVAGQNNTPANIYLAFDQSTTISGDQVYVIAPGQAFSFDRQGTVLHFSSPAQQSFGGLSGITVEAFA